MLDPEWLVEVARGQSQALGALYDRYAGLLLATLTRVLRDGREAEDVELGYFDGMSSAEIAAHEGLAVGTLKSRVARALGERRDVSGPA